ncbi:signal peptidase I [Paenibacillus timonensis]|nr:signal peptidase I [Paenibacillus timonensis]MUG86518.1 signal peptidase I [Paenibacillus timonensis]
MKIVSALCLLLTVILGNSTEKTFIIEGPSMSPTINNGDQVTVNTDLNDPIVKDDIIIFEQDNKSFCKRVIGVEGDHIELVGTRIGVNGIELFDTEFHMGNDTEIILQKDEFFCPRR